MVVLVVFIIRVIRVIRGLLLSVVMVVFLNLRAASGARTRDLRLGKPLLYQLSYCRETKRTKPRSLVLVEPITRLELVTHALRMRCSTN